jgi:hypothetical protein
MKWISFFCLTSILFLTSAFSVFKNRVIYGDDNRMDLYEVQDADVVRISRSTAAMIKISNLNKINTIYQITSGQFGQEMQLCQDEPFYSQPNAAFCSAFLVAPDMVATAGHCVSSSDCSTVAFIFDYAMKNATVAPVEVAEEDVYFCKAIVKRELTNQQDYSLVQLDRPVAGHDPLKLASTPAQANDDVFVVGHPSGLPTKIAGGAEVRKQNGAFFTSNLDTYGGNSGSAVFNAKTLEVEGILVRGETDFAFDKTKSCYRSNRCAANACRGEDATNISFIEKALTTTYLE